MRKKRSVVFYTISCFIVAYVLFDAIFNYLTLTDYYRDYNAARTPRLTDAHYMANKVFDLEQNFDNLENFLKHMEHSKLVDFWAIYHEGEIYKSSEGVKGNEGLKYLPKELNLKLVHNYRDIGMIYADFLDPNFVLLMGVRHREDNMLKNFYQDNAKLYTAYAISAISVFSIIFLFFIRDIIEAVRALGSRHGRRYGKMKSRSLESDILIRGVSGYEDKVQALERANAVLGNQVLPSLKKEILRGKKPPYEFSCTLARVDINNFSQIFNNNNVEEFVAIINEFFTDASHVISRYDGLVHEFVGDEIIFYIKDEDSPNSIAAMLTCLRDINSIARTYHERTLRENNYPFTIKSTFAHGRIRFGRLVNGFSLAGESLIETVRILSTVVEKEGNVIVFDSRHNSALARVAKVEAFGEISLKGFTGTKSLSRYVSHRPVEELLMQGLQGGIADISVYRSDQDLETVFKWARSQSETKNYGATAEALTILRKVRLTEGGDGPRGILMTWITDLNVRLSNSNSDHIAQWYKILSGLIKLVENFTPLDKFTPDMEKKLHKCSTSSDRRVVANCLDVLTYFKSHDDPAYALELTNHEDNRIAANALLHEGISELNSRVVKSLAKMLHSPDPGRVSSAAWAVGELAQYYRVNDPVYLATQVDFLDLVQYVRSLIKHPNDMVRRQANAAVMKYEGPEFGGDSSGSRAA